MASNCETTRARPVRVVAVAGVAEGQCDVGAVFPNSLDSLRRLGLDVRDGDARVVLGEVREQAGHDRRRCGRERDQAHTAGAQTAQLGEFAGRGIQCCRDGRRVAGEDATGFGQTHAATDPLDHRHAEPLFEPLHLLTQRRLTVAESGGGRRDRALVGDRLDHPQRLHVELGVVENAVAHG